ncbi:amidohydrolase [Parafrankia soli]|uniref:Amidohydrolase n=1 Tax=Parafrankia soli TaxID=2599596 RepID=A0A1S1PUP6_9ACTN|nr:amidohydrolase family protein [Parafrankia soli]ABW14069.1 amidohydrolase 2 [Frankia sp. EAN1pec]OHV26433.1 amidohydrolase [Parafrankia soli]
MDYKVISADNHIIEAPHTFTTYLPKEYRDRAPRILRGADGGDGWSFDGKPPSKTFGLNAVAGRPFEDYKASGLTVDEILPGNYDGAAHLKDMDADGVDAATIYPMASLTSYTLDDRPFALAILRAYNDWLLDEFCAVNPQRLIGLPLLPVDDGMDVLLAELERVAAKGAKGAFLPYWSERPYYDSYYEPLWTAAEQAPLTLCIHRTMGGKEPAGQATPRPEAAAGVNLAGIVQRFFTGVAPFSQLTFTGVFERHPGLKFVDAEVNFGWLRFWALMMDQEFERQKHWANPPLHTPPHEFIGKNLFVSVLDDFVGFEDAKRDPLVASAAMFSIDYPHSGTLFPKTQQYIAELTPGLDDDRKHAILAGNAVRVFNLA